MTGRLEIQRSSQNPLNNRLISTDSGKTPSTLIEKISDTGYKPSMQYSEVAQPVKFTCPLCGSFSFTSVKILRDNGTSYLSDFFQCVGCSALFREPALFSAALRHREEMPKEKPLMFHEDAYLHREETKRYWEARARRLNGGHEPTESEISALRRREDK
jgi:predicted RNA-binding Zn-ribbon protein involved in translation (DUF1610 family)